MFHAIAPLITVHYILTGHHRKKQQLQTSYLLLGHSHIWSSCLLKVSALQGLIQIPGNQSHSHSHLSPRWYWRNKYILLRSPHFNQSRSHSHLSPCWYWRNSTSYWEAPTSTNLIHTLISVHAGIGETVYPTCLSQLKSPHFNQSHLCKDGYWSKWPCRWLRMSTNDKPSPHTREGTLADAWQ